VRPCSGGSFLDSSHALLQLQKQTNGKVAPDPHAFNGKAAPDPHATISVKANHSFIFDR
jgi:hypothetical protein